VNYPAFPLRAPRAPSFRPLCLARWLARAPTAMLTLSQSRHGARAPRKCDDGEEPRARRQRGPTARERWGASVPEHRSHINPHIESRNSLPDRCAILRAMVSQPFTLYLFF